jgi:hypothetical protein
MLFTLMLLPGLGVVQDPTGGIENRASLPHPSFATLDPRAATASGKDNMT